MTSTEPLRVAKGHGTRNDFVLVDDPDGRVDLTADLVCALADRRGGIGSDGVIRVIRSAALDPDERAAALAADGTDDGRADDGGAVPEWFMDYRNADGSIAEMCGNGVRVFGTYLLAAGLAGPDPHSATAAGAGGVPASGPADGGGAIELRVLTRAGVKTLRVVSWDGPRARVSVSMGTYRLDGEQTVTVNGRELLARSVDLGNPHTVALLPPDLALATLDLVTAPTVSPVPPHGTNAEFVRVTGPRSVAMRVHERGVGETESCGTGACATAIATDAVLEPGACGRAEWQVSVPGGLLDVLVDRDAHTVTLTGPAEIVATGTWPAF